jgi:hypothetical protein
MKQAISGAITNRKGTTKMTVKNKGKNGSQIHLKADSKIHQKNDPKTTLGTQKTQ